MVVELGLGGEDLAAGVAGVLEVGGEVDRLQVVPITCIRSQLFYLTENRFSPPEIRFLKKILIS